MQEQVISDEVFALLQFELLQGNHWIAYNGSLYFIDRNDLHFFNNAEAAHRFAQDNVSDRDHFHVIHLRSPEAIFRAIPYGVSVESTLKLSSMNEKNFEYLKDTIKYHGFGEGLHSALEQQLQSGAASFQLAFTTQFNKKDLEATLHFRKSDSTDLYFFNQFDVRTQTAKNETVSQTFYLKNAKGVTLKEAYNLLQGRAVHKELLDKQDQPYKAWVQLDFATKDKYGNYERKQYHENYGYDLREALSYYPVKELLNKEEQASVLRSLEKGNLQQVTLVHGDQQTKVFIEANPQYKGVTLYDADLKRLNQTQREALMVKPDLANGKGKDQQMDEKKKVSAKKDDLDQKERPKRRMKM